MLAITKKIKLASTLLVILASVNATTVDAKTHERILYTSENTLKDNAKMLLDELFQTRYVGNIPYGTMYMYYGEVTTNESYASITYKEPTYFELMINPAMTSKMTENQEGLAEICSQLFIDDMEISQYAKPYIPIAVSKGVISGMENSVFGAKSPMTRQQLAVVLFNTGNIEKANEEEIQSVLDDGCASWAAAAYASMQNVMLDIKSMTGDNSNMYNESVTKAEFLYTLAHMFFKDELTQEYRKNADNMLEIPFNDITGVTRIENSDFMDTTYGNGTSFKSSVLHGKIKTEYLEAMLLLYDKGIYQGYDNDSRWQEEIKREDVIVFLTRTIQMYGAAL